MRQFYRLFFLFALLNFGFTVCALAQQNDLDQLKAKLKAQELKKNFSADTSYLNTLNRIVSIYADSYPDSALLILPTLLEDCKSSGYKAGEVDAINLYGNAYQTKGNYEKALEYYEKAYTLAEKGHFKKNLPGLLGNIATMHLNQGNYPVALQKYYASLKAAESVDNKPVIMSSYNNIGTVYFYQGKMNEAETAYKETLKIAAEIADTSSMALAYNNIGEVNLEQNDPAKALQNLSVAFELAKLKKIPGILVAVTNTLADTYFRLDSTQKSYEFFENALTLSKQQGNGRAICKALIGLAKVQKSKGLYKDALASGLEALQKAEHMGQVQLKRDAYEIVADIYEAMGDGNNAIKYFRKFKIYADSLQSLESERIVANYKAENEFSKKEQEFVNKTIQQRWLIFSAFAAALTLLIIVWIINRNKKRLSHTYKDLQHKNLIIEGQKQKAEETLSKLKATQTQLIQSEKMASLGELTAGIAHEIQNPLNFVNNFSEVSNELLEEMKGEMAKGNYDDAKEIAEDVKQNLEKINHHGKRADAIVKGMLQHSRSSSAVKEPTDINKLADEYLRLSYHGLRAKDKSFNATMKTDFDNSIGKINIIPQDIGRVILNLLTNAFYAVNEKKNALANSTESYEPTVSVSTKKVGHQIEIKVTDNGNGIPDSVKEKIFQPFFTTKPTGQGTGLGLSLSYDIVTKGHGGELKVETNENEGTGFTIILPE
ncbi:MAG: tetratricopeptide repeat protein [Ferruginibacter sp.]